MEYNGEDIRKAQMEQRQRILKSFGETNLFSGEGDSNKLMRSMEKAEENDIEKAKHQDGDMHPNGRWVWRQSANGGKGDWRVANPSKRGGGSRTASASKQTDESSSKTKFFTVSESDLKNVKKEFDDALDGVDLSEQDKDDVKQMLYDIASDALKKNYTDAEDKAAKVGNRDFNLLNAERKDTIDRIISTYLLGKNVSKKDDKKSASSTTKTTISSEGDKKGNGIYNKKLTDLTDEEFNKIYEDSKKMYHQILMNKNINETSRQSAESAMKKLEDEKKRRKGDGKKQTDSNSVTHDINGTKVTVTKNNDGSYTLEAKGKKVKSDDPSFFVNGANLKPRVKKALAKEVGIDSDTTIQNKKR